MRRGMALPNTACESNIKKGTAFPGPRGLCSSELFRSMCITLIFRALQGKALPTPSSRPQGLGRGGFTHPFFSPP